MQMDPNIKTIDGFISSFPPDIQKILEEVRASIRKAAPDATEKISYKPIPYDLIEKITLYRVEQQKSKKK
jgi:uncharacterized protein YdhG (YjbR/CyaY superfamily)